MRLRRVTPRLAGLTSCFDCPFSGRRSNSLIPLAPSGSYLELITFNADPPPASHEWGRGLAGPIDYALFGGLKDGQKEAVEQVAAERRDTSLAYREPVAGGRVRPDGKRLECAFRRRFLRRACDR